MIIVNVYRDLKGILVASTPTPILARSPKEPSALTLLWVVLHGPREPVKQTWALKPQISLSPLHVGAMLFDLLLQVAP